MVRRLFALSGEARCAAGMGIGYVPFREKSNTQTALERDLVWSHLPEGVVVQDARGIVRFCNPSAVRILGLSEQEIIGRSFPDSRSGAVRGDGTPYPAHENPALVTMQVGEPQSGIVMGLPRTDGTLVWISVATSPMVREAELHPCGVVTSFSDISHAREKELAAEVQRRTSELDTLFSAMNEGVLLYDSHGMIFKANSAAVDILGLDPHAIGREALLGLVEVRRADGFPLAVEETPGARALRGEQVTEEELILVNRKGETLVVLVSGAPLIDAGRVVGGVIVARDITESKRSEERLKASLREKEMLLKEVHHRVKNNLQVIASMLNLQAGSVYEDPVRVALRDSQNRIRTLALIHEKLYGARDVAEIPIKEYIQDLTSSLFRSLTPQSATVSLDLDVADVLLDIDAAIPVALILNELVSNSLEHAFPQGGDGAMSITFKPISASRYKMVVADNGEGFPEGLDFRNSDSLGLQLVCLLSKQLGGNIELDRRAGTQFTIEFDELEKVGWTP
ncbi:MAG: histidine kinase dimerization/phosphoacceptor domain -containing protein [Acidobacteriota bacterium]